MKTSKILVLFALVAGSFAATLTVNLEIRDFLAKGDSVGSVGGHPDFESFCCESVKGLVENKLGVDGIPVRTSFRPDVISNFDSMI